MTDQQNTEGLVVQPQSEEVREHELAQAPKGDATATGKISAQADESERISSLDSRGATQPIAGGDSIVADGAGNDTQKPVGLQAEQAFVSRSGTVDPTFVASSSGPIPVGAVASSTEAAQKRLEEHHKSIEAAVQRQRGQYQPLTEQQINSMTGAELRAVGQDRGYDLTDGGTRTTRRRFAQAQAKDQSFTESNTEE